MSRANLSGKTAISIRRARTALGLSQYDLAEKLGWPRSKIKRLEKHEVQSVEKSDLKLLRRELGLSRGASVRKTTRRASSVVPPGVLRPLREVPRGIDGLLFLEVAFDKSILLRDLRGARYRHGDGTYTVNGIEHTSGQGPVFEAPQRVVLMLWRLPDDVEATSAPPAGRKKPKADKGRPKPRLDYHEGTKRVLRALSDAKKQGHLWMDRGGIERDTGYTPCQVRAFCKRLEAKGLLRRVGKGRGMQYVPVE